MLKKRGPGRPKGSTNKATVTASQVKSQETVGMVQLALNQITHENHFRNIEKALTTQGAAINSCVSEVNKGFATLAARIEALEARVSDLEHKVTEKEPQRESKPEGENLEPN